MYGQFAARRAPVQSIGGAGLGLLFTILSASMLAGVATAQAGAPEPAAAPELRFARITAETTQPYCWPSAVAAPPRFADVLEKDQVVQVGRTEGTFVRVQLPLGPTGYVSKRYATTGDDGVVRSKGSKVSFRYRMVTTEAPVQQLEDGTVLFVIGEEGDWWQVRIPAVETWLPQTEVAIGDPADATLAADFAASKATYEQEINARLEAIAAERARIDQDRADAAAVQLVQEAFQAELQKPVAEQVFAPLASTLDKVEATFGEKAQARALVASLRQRIQTQQWIVEATLVKNEKPVPSSDPLPEVQPEDKLARFQSIGWLRYEERLGGLGFFYLEKGGLRLNHVNCSSGRYDLSLFVNCEVGLMGPRRRPTTEDFTVLDVERLEVLGHTRN